MSDEIVKRKNSDVRLGCFTAIRSFIEHRAAEIFVLSVIGALIGVFALMFGASFMQEKIFENVRVVTSGKTGGYSITIEAPARTEFLITFADEVLTQVVDQEGKAVNFYQEKMTPPLDYEADEYFKGSFLRTSGSQPETFIFFVEGPSATFQVEAKNPFTLKLIPEGPGVFDVIKFSLWYGFWSLILGAFLVGFIAKFVLWLRK